MLLSKVRTAILLVGFGGYLSSSGCGRPEVIWSAEARSLGGTMVATARTVAQSGFGTDYIETLVYLNWTKGSQSPKEILGLSNGTVAPGATSVAMKWLTPTHLELTYRGPTPKNKCSPNEFRATHQQSSPQAPTLRRPPRDGEGRPAMPTDQSPWKRMFRVRRGPWGSR